MIQLDSTSFELKGGLFTLTALYLNTGNINGLEKQLRAKVDAAPGFFKQAPVVINLQSLPSKTAIDLVRVKAILNDCGLIAVGVQGANQQMQEVALRNGLAILSEGQLQPKNHTEKSTAAVKSKATAKPKVTAKPSTTAKQGNVAKSSPKFISKTIRSGQQVYAQGGDLIVLSSVGPGAEILADGNIIVYGVLRGRALAGVKGDKNAYICCQTLDAELVSIAGCYQLFDEAPFKQQSQSGVYVRLAGEKLLFETNGKVT